MGTLITAVQIKLSEQQRQKEVANDFDCLLSSAADPTAVHERERDEQAQDAGSSGFTGNGLDGYYPSRESLEAGLEALVNQKRGGYCVRRGGNCDNRPNECCYSSACRCNLWGTNCKCQRVGLLQKWGR